MMRFIRKIERLFISPKWSDWSGDPSCAVRLDLRIYPSLWVEGKWNEMSRWYNDLRKRKGLKYGDSFGGVIKIKK